MTRSTLRPRRGASSRTGILLAAAMSATMCAATLTSAAAQGTNGPAHGMAMHGTPKYPADFAHFDYVDPDAPKGGTVVQQAFGTYDNLNPFIVRGSAAVGLGNTLEQLTVPSMDEPFTRYCLICETMEVPDDRSWVEFVLNPDARWHDGEPITVDDVIFSFETIKASNPFVGAYYANVERVERTGERSVRFTFSGDTNMELPLIIAELNILPKHYWDGRDFEATTLEPPVASGPYRIRGLNPGTSITYERIEDYWAADHPVNVGRHNFDVLRFEYFRDPDVAREAFKGGEIDFWVENQSKAWATSFDVPAVRQGQIVKEEIAHSRGAGMQGFVINTRREKFQDRRVREALSYAFDFETTNKDLFYGAYTRTDSYFENSELASRGLLADAGAEEREILERFRGQLPDELYTEEFTVPTTDGTAGAARANIAKGGELLDAAGWPIVNGKRVNSETGETLEIEILLVSPAFERIVLPYVSNLKRMGIEASARLVDTAQYTNLTDNYDFDMLVTTFGQSESPGNEQRAFWGSEGADVPGGRNLIGIKDPVIDELVDLVISAPTRESLVQRTRALDRALLWGHYVVPNWHVPFDRVAYWDKFGRPEVTPDRGVQFDTWWINTAKAEQLAQRQSTPGGTTGSAGGGEPPDAPPAPDTPDEPASAESGGGPWLWIAIAVVVLAAIALIMRRRKGGTPA